MNRLWSGLVLGALLAAPVAHAAEVEDAALASLQGRWQVQEWTGYKPLAMFSGFMSASYEHAYAGSILVVEGTNTTWKLTVSPQMKGLLLGLFSSGGDLDVQKDGDVTYYVDRAAITAASSGSPGRLNFRATQGEGAKLEAEYLAIWTLEGDTLVVCKNKTAGGVPPDTMGITSDDFFHTRIVLKRAPSAP